MAARWNARSARRAAVVEPHVMQRMRTAEVLRENGGLDVVHASESVGSLLVWMRGQERSNWPHILLIEMLPLQEGGRDLAAVTTLREAGVRVVLVSALMPRGAARRIIEAGIDGVVSKRDSEETFLGSVADVLTGAPLAVTALAQAAIAADPRAPQLSLQEAKVMGLYVTGRQIAEVAEEIGVREDTARKYLARAKRKYAALGRPASSKLDLARLAWEDGLAS